MFRLLFRFGVTAALACVLVALSCAQAAAAPPGRVPGYLIIPLGRGHFNRLCLAATVAGTKGLMMLDTGAMASGLSTGKYGFLRHGDAKLPAGIPATRKVNGTTVPLVMARDYQVAGVTLGSLPLSLIGQRYLYDRPLLYDRDDGRAYDGLLGEDILRTYRAVVDCGRLVLYLNTDPARRALHLGSALSASGWNAIPMTDVRTDFAVPCTVNGHRFEVIVDTGAPFTTMDSDLLRGAGVASRDTPLNMMAIGEHAQSVQMARLDDLQIGDYKAASVVLCRPAFRRFLESLGVQTAGAPCIGVIGGDFLAHNRAIVDIGGHVLYLRASAAAPKR